MALPIGTAVRVLPPFDSSFPGTYVTVPAPEPAEGEPVDTENNYLEGPPGAFCDLYLEAV